MADPVSENETDILSQGLFEYLSEDVGIDLPEIDLDDPKYNYIKDTNSPLYKDVPTIDIESLTERKICGNGVFDAIMDSYSKHLTQEYEKGRINANEFANVYVQISSQAMSQSIQFLLARDQTYWSSILVQAQAQHAQIQATTALIHLATAKMQAGITAAEFETSKANYSLTKIKLASEDANYAILKRQHDIIDIDLRLKESDLSVMRPLEVASVTMDNTMKQFQMDEMLPAQKDLTEAQADLVRKDVDLKDNELTLLRPLQVGIVESQLAESVANVNIKEFQLSDMMPAEKDMIAAQVSGIETDNLLKNHEMTIMRPLAVIAAETDNSMKIFQMEEILPTEKLHLVEQTKLVGEQAKKVEKEVEQITFEVEEMQPVQRLVLLAQEDQIKAGTNKVTAEISNITYNTDFIQPAQRANIESDTLGKTVQAESLLPAQVENTLADTNIKTYTHMQVLPVQKALTEEQMESKRAETLDTRSDGITVVGTVGKQKALYDQQRISYMRDAEIKAARMFIDSWITQKGLDEGLAAPTALQNASVDAVMQSIKAKNEIQ